MPDVEHGQSDTESLTRGPRRLDPAGPAASGTGAAEDVASLRAQFRDAFTPGAEWTFGGAGDIGLIH